VADDITYDAGPWHVTIGSDGKITYFNRDGVSEVLPTPHSREAVLGIVDDRPVFIIREVAEDLAKTWAVLSAADRTIEQAVAEIPARYRDRVAELCSDVEPETVDDLASLVLDNDVLDWPSQLMLSWIPDEIQRLYEDPSPSMQFSASSGPCLTFRVDVGEQVASALQATGFVVERHDNLVCPAMGL
jgi:hypothetical protein